MAVDTDEANPGTIASPAARWLLSMMQIKDINRLQLSEAAGVDQGHLGRALRHPKGPSRVYLRKISEHLGWQVPVDIMAGAPKGRGNGPKTETGISAKRRAVALPTIASSHDPSKLPVHSAYGTNTGPGFWINFDSSHDINRPAGLRADARCFAFCMPGDSMVPWRRPGEMVVVNPQGLPRVGSHVCVRFAIEALPDLPTDQWMLALLEARGVDPRRPTLRIYGPHTQELDMSNLSAADIWPVVEWQDMLT